MNTFGTSTLKFPLCDPREAIANRQRFAREAIPDLEKANSLSCPLGREAATGWVLLPYYEYAELDAYSTSFQLTADELILSNLAIRRAQCVSTGLITDPNALYLIEITDRRGILSNRWFQYPINAQYNMRAPAYPQLYYSGSLNAGVAWTWSQMIENLWPSLLGTFPGLPTVPANTPENWYFAGVPVWKALNDVLDHLGMAIAYGTSYTIVNQGVTDAAFTALQTLYAPNLEDDLNWLDEGSGRFPKTVIVYFRRRQEQYGQEETVRRDGSQWSSTPLYAISVNTAYTDGVGYHYLHDDFTIRVDYDGVELAADVATATTIATERVTQYLRTIDDTMTQVYAGALPFYPGSKIDKVCWKQKDRGWQTTIEMGR